MRVTGVRWFAAHLRRAHGEQGAETPCRIREDSGEENRRTAALGATAGKALLGSTFRVTQQRGALLPWPTLDGPGEADEGIRGPVATIHPSAVLRADDRESVYQGLVSDLRVVAEVLDGQRGI